MLTLVFYLFLIFLINCQGTTVSTSGQGSSNVHIVYLGEREHDDPNLVKESHHHMLASVLGISKEMAAQQILYSYRHGFSGFAAKLTNTQARMISELPGVVRVMRNSFYQLQTSRSWDFLGLQLSTHNNSTQNDDLLYKANMGDGVIIGVFDTGIWPESKSFTDGALGPIPPHWKGMCDAGEQFNPIKHCNRKLIGAKWFVKGFLSEYGKPLNDSGDIEFLSPRDANGHGTHTASTAAGSILTNVSYKGMARGTVRGGAPRARLAVYKVCWNVFGGQCSSADILKAFDEAIHDGVDVLSLSIGGSIPLFSEVDDHDGIAVGSFHAVARGIAVICGAANDGPAAFTVQNTAPWILTVAASTMDRVFSASITLGNGETVKGQALYSGKEIHQSPLVYPEATPLDPTSSGICQNLSPNATRFANTVVLCFTSVNRRAAVTIASSAVKLSGGRGIIIAKNPTDGLAPCVQDFPCIEVDYVVGTRLLYYIRSTSSPVVTLKPTVTAVGESSTGGAKVAYFSSRGPSSITPDILKPDIAAPGVNILAATSPFDPSEDNGYALHSGTSMSTPHVSGIVALLKALHPNWSPAAIKSSILTTGRRISGFDFPIQCTSSSKIADPFDYGGGIITPNEAATVGLVYDIGTIDYVDYMCRRGYNEAAISRLVGRSVSCKDRSKPIADLNLPSITISRLESISVIERMVTNVGEPWSTYWAEIESPIGTSVAVMPRVLRFSAMVKKMVFKVVVRPLWGGNGNGGYYFGSLTWSNGVNRIRIPIAVQMDGGVTISTSVVGTKKE